MFTLTIFFFYICSIKRPFVIYKKSVIQNLQVVFQVPCFFLTQYKSVLDAFFNFSRSQKQVHNINQKVFFLRYKLLSWFGDQTHVYFIKTVHCYLVYLLNRENNNN